MGNTGEQVVTDETCFVNIGPKEHQKRLVGGLFSFVIGVAIVIGLIAFNASPWLGLITLPFFYAAGSGFFQWRDKT